MPHWPSQFPPDCHCRRVWDPAENRDFPHGLQALAHIRSSPGTLGITQCLCVSSYVPAEWPRIQSRSSHAGNSLCTSELNQRNPSSCGCVRSWIPFQLQDFCQGMKLLHCLSPHPFPPHSWIWQWHLCTQWFLQHWTLLSTAWGTGRSSTLWGRCCNKHYSSFHKMDNFLIGFPVMVLHVLCIFDCLIMWDIATCKKSVIGLINKNVLHLFPT